MLSLALVLGLGTIPWLLTVAMVSIGCEGDSEAGVCSITSKGNAVLLLAGFQLLPIVGWMLERQRKSVSSFAWCAATSLGVNLVLAVVSVLWASGDLA